MNAWQVFFVLTIPLVFFSIGCRSFDHRGQDTSCSVHLVPLQEDTVQVVYGMPLPIDYELYIAEKTEFPYAKTFSNAGCLRASTSRARVRYCPECRSARAKYFESTR